MQYAIIDLFGRKRLIGTVAEEKVGEVTFLKVQTSPDAPAVLYHPNAIYSIEYCTREKALSLGEPVDYDEPDDDQITGAAYQVECESCHEMVTPNKDFTCPKCGGEVHGLPF